MTGTRTVAALLACGLLCGCLLSEEEHCLVSWAPQAETPSLYPEPTVCDPLALPTKQLHPQPPVVVGEGADGDLVVLDRVDDPAASRLLVSDGETLRRREAQIETRREGEDLYIRFVSAQVSGLVRLRNTMTVPPNIVPEQTEMVTTEAEADPDALAEAFEQGTPLGVLTECAATGREVIGLPQRRVVEYLAQDEDGARILVVRPEVDWDVQSATLFYGPPDGVLQRRVTAFGRHRDGGTTDIVFDDAGQEARLRFVVGCNGPFTHDCEGVLELPGETRTVSIPEREVPVPEGETYLCHDG